MLFFLVPLLEVLRFFFPVEAAVLLVTMDNPAVDPAAEPNVDPAVDPNDDVDPNDVPVPNDEVLPNVEVEAVLEVEMDGAPKGVAGVAGEAKDRVEEGVEAAPRPKARVEDGAAPGDANDTGEATEGVPKRAEAAMELVAPVVPKKEAGVAGVAGVTAVGDLIPRVELGVPGAGVTGAENGARTDFLLFFGSKGLLLSP